MEGSIAQCGDLASSPWTQLQVTCQSCQPRAGDLGNSPQPSHPGTHLFTVLLVLALAGTQLWTLEPHLVSKHVPPSQKPASRNLRTQVLSAPTQPWVLGGNLSSLSKACGSAPHLTPTYLVLVQRKWNTFICNSFKKLTCRNYHVICSYGKPRWFCSHFGEKYGFGQICTFSFYWSWNEFPTSWLRVREREMRGNAMHTSVWRPEDNPGCRSLGTHP